LAFEVQHLLLRLGIVARRYVRVRSHKGRKLEHYVVTVTGAEPLQQFWKQIGRRFIDRRKREQSRELAKPRNGRMSRDIVPAEIRAVIRRERDESRLTWREIGELTGLGMREVLATSDVYWDKVIGIEALGDQSTYDLKIEGDHNFIANHLVVHNSHACSFALLVYDSAWLKHYEPAAFTCALLNSQPMGFYAPAQLVRDTRAHGVEVRPVSVEASDWDCTLEEPETPDEGTPQPALRLGLRLVKSLSESAAKRVMDARREHPFTSVEDLARRASLDRGDLEALAAAGALASLSGNRHLAFWEVAGAERPWALGASDSGMSERAGQMHPREARPLLSTPTEGESIQADYASVGLTLGRHPLALLRERLRAERISSAAELLELPHGRLVRTAGLVLLRQHPSSAKGVTFMTLEDETGQVNLIVWSRIGETQRRPLVESRLLEVRGKVQRLGEILHVVAHRLIDRSELVAGLATGSRDFH
jgi:hypothetical protein